MSTNLVRTATGFQEFAHNGKVSLCEDNETKKHIYLRKKKN